jgi:hypothetical protein
VSPVRAIAPISASASAPASAPASASASASASAPASASASAPASAPASASASAPPPPLEDKDRTLAALRPRFNACYSQALTKEPTLSGATVLTAVLEKDGTVQSASASKTEGLPPSVVACLIEVVKLAKFAPPSASQLTSVDVPLRFSVSY